MHVVWRITFTADNVINAHCLFMQDDASSPGDLVVTDNAGGEY